MGSADYVFETRWRVPARIEEVSEILGEPTDLPRWWPSVYMVAKEVEAGDPKTNVGRVIELYTKGWLPYTLRWSFRVTDNRKPHGFSIEAFGDFEGVGVWTFTQDGEHAEIVYDWRVRAGKPLLRHLSFLMKPIFAANHHWAMARGEESLRLELQRRHAPPGERDALPAPRGPTFAWFR